MRLELITRPFLESDMSIKEFSSTTGLSTQRVSQILKRDLASIHYELFRNGSYELRRLPLSKEDRVKWLNRLNEYVKLINLPEKIIRDNRKISELTVHEFVSLVSYLKLKK